MLILMISESSNDHNKAKCSTLFVIYILLFVVVYDIWKLFENETEQEHKYRRLMNMLMTKHRKKTFDELKKSKFSSFVIKVIMTVAETFSDQLIQLITDFKCSD